MVILGISDNHDSGACLIRNGHIISAANEERFTGEKLEGGFPYLSIDNVIKNSRITFENIDVVTIASLMTPAFLLRLIDRFHNNFRKKSSSFSYLLNLYIIYQVLAYKTTVPFLIEKYLSRKILERKIKNFGVKAKVILLEHHYAHAASAFFTSGFSHKSLVVTADAIGDALSVTVSIGENNRLKRIFSQTGLSSISTYYSRLTEFLGFRPLRHEGKITGLAGYGKYNAEIIKFARNILHFDRKEGRFNYTNYFIKSTPRKGVYKKLRRYLQEDIAYNFQKNFEEEIVKFISFWLKRTGIDNLCLAGGIFANVSLNKKIAEISFLKRVYIFPYMGDGGLAVGSALGFLRPKPFYLRNIYLGSSFSDNYVSAVLLRKGLKYSVFEEDKLCRKVAYLLHKGKVIAHFNGRMEYGPRALGNRSILYRADDLTCKEWLNRKLRRSSFMPFAPVTLADEAEELYINISKIKYTLRFMNIAVDCSEKMKRECPGAVHIDGTARPQILYKEDNPRLYKILTVYKKLKGISTIINTSFNQHEKPIVFSPEDAINSFLEARLDYLVLNNFIIENPIR